jgi:hypothetical protein
MGFAHETIPERDGKPMVEAGHRAGDACSIRPVCAMNEHQP